jgi:hypothetical protein
MVWDSAGVDLPDLRIAPDADGATARWTEIIAGRLLPDHILVVTDVRGEVLLVTAI